MTTSILKNILQEKEGAVVAEVKKVLSSNSYLVRDPSGRMFVVSSTAPKVVGNYIRILGGRVVDSARPLSKPSIFMV